MQNQAEEEYLTEVHNIQVQAISLIDQLVERNPYPLTFDVDWNLETVFKALNVHLDFMESSIGEQVGNYIKVLHQILGKQVFFTINLRLFLDEDTLEKLYEDMIYEDIWLIDVERAVIEKKDREHLIILDEDYCVIEMD